MPGNNQNVMFYAVPAFICPSTPRRSSTLTVDYGGVFNSALAGAGILLKGGAMDYPATSRAAEPLTTASGETFNRGILSDEQFTRIRDVIDGTSNTSLVCERAGAPTVYRKGKAVSGGDDKRRHVERSVSRCQLLSRISVRRHERQIGNMYV